MITCPGCGHLLRYDDDCDTCEYFNLASGRYHYCGDNGCHCRNLRGTIRAAVLERFADEFRVRFAGRTYREMTAEQLGLLP